MSEENKVENQDANQTAPVETAEVAENQGESEAKPEEVAA